MNSPSLTWYGNSLIIPPMTEQDTVSFLGARNMRRAEAAIALVGLGGLLIAGSLNPVFLALAGWGTVRSIQNFRKELQLTNPERYGTYKPVKGLRRLLRP